MDDVKKPKKNVRASTKNAGLNKKMNLKSRYDLIDYDYLNKLSEEELDWLNRFSEEFIGANFQHKGEILHNTQALKKDCFDKNNARNRCQLSRAKSQGKVVSTEDLDKEELIITEDEFIQKLDDDK